MVNVRNLTFILLVLILTVSWHARGELTTELPTRPSQPASSFKLPQYGDSFAGTLEQRAGIYGKDDRIHEDSVKYPLSSVGRVILPDGSHCSGTMITECHLITNAHCFRNFQDQKKGVVKFQHALVVNTNLAGQTKRLGIRDVDSTLGQLKNVEYGIKSKNENDYLEKIGDWAVVKLDRNIGQQIGWMAWRPVDLKRDVGNPKSQFVMTGYHADCRAGKKACSQENVKLREIRDGIVYHDADSLSGSSGSSLWRWQKSPNGSGVTEPTIVAINTATWMKTIVSTSGEKRTINVNFSAHGDVNKVSRGISISSIEKELRRAIEKHSCR